MSQHLAGVEFIREPSTSVVASPWLLKSQREWLDVWMMKVHRCFATKRGGSFVLFFRVTLIFYATQSLTVKRKSATSVCQQRRLAWYVQPLHLQHCLLSTSYNDDVLFITRRPDDVIFICMAESAADFWRTGPPPRRVTAWSLLGTYT